MRKTYRLIFFLFLLTGVSFLGLKNRPQVLSFFHLQQKQAVTASANEGNQKKIIENYAKFPLSFVLNEGQFDSKVTYVSRGIGYNLFLTPSEAVIALNKSGAKDANKQEVLKMQLVGANSDPKVVGIDELPGKVNYFYGNNKTKWQANVPMYAKVKYTNAYNGIDLVYYGTQRQLEYDFVVSPGANPNNIVLGYKGTQKQEIDTQGNLLLTLGGEQIQMRKPAIYQQTDSGRKDIDGGYLLADNNTLSFQIADYDTSKPLIIDPLLSYSTYLGGSNVDVGTGIAIGPDDSIYISGQTQSSDFPTASPYQSQNQSLNGNPDTFVTRLSADGSTLIYSTYLGGTNSDGATGIAVDTTGAAYVTGHTNSTDFPTNNPYQSALPSNTSASAFVTKLSADGSSLIYSTYLGGSSGTTAQKIVVDSDNNAYVSGDTVSTNFPTTNAFQSSNHGQSDIFVTKFSTDGTSLVYSTYLGGSIGDVSHGLAVDASKNVYVTGHTDSTDYPTTSNAYQSTRNDPIGDVFVTKLTADGNNLAYSTYIGGAYYGYGIVVNNDGAAYITGSPYSHLPAVNALFPVQNPGFESFLIKLAPDGGTLLFSTYLGGNEGYGMAIDGASNVYISGNTQYTNFPTYHPIQPTRNGAADAYLTKVASDGQSLIYSTYLGGTSEDEYATAVAVDSTGNYAYVTGFTSSTDFPVVSPFQSSNHGLRDAFVAKIFDDGSNLPPTVDSGGPYTVHEGETVILTATGNDPENGPLTFAWDLDNDGTFETPGDSVTFSAATLNGPSTYTVAVRVTDDANQTATAQTTVEVVNADPTIGAVGISPNPAQVNRQVTATASFTDTGISDTHTATWNWGDGNTTTGTVTESNGSGTISNTHTYTSAGSYTLTLTVTDSDGGVKTRSRTILVR